MKALKEFQKAYLAGFLDGDGSIYVRLKPNNTYKYGFQFAPSVILFQSAKDRDKFQEICNLIDDLGYIRERKDGILEFTIGRQDNILKFMRIVEPYVLLKDKQVALMQKILHLKPNIKSKSDFIRLAKLVDTFRDLNYSKKRKKHILTP